MSKKIWLPKNVRNALNPNKKPNFKPRKCEICESIFSPRNNVQKYCSEACYLESRKRGGVLEPKICLNCGLEYTSINHKFCSLACCREYVSKMREERIERERAKIENTPIGQCPLLEKCRKLSGIDCSKRNHLKCDFYRTLLREKKGTQGHFKDKGEIEIAQ